MLRKRNQYMEDKELIYFGLYAATNWVLIGFYLLMEDMRKESTLTKVAGVILITLFGIVTFTVLVIDHIRMRLEKWY